MADARTRYFRRLDRLRRSGRRWSVLAGGLTAATAVLLPYHGIGLPDVFWAAGAGTTGMLAAWRLSDARALAAQPAPPASDPLATADRARQLIEGVLMGLPGGRTALTEVRRTRARVKLRGLSVAAGWARLDRAAQTLAGLAPRLGEAAGPAVAEAADAERELRDIAVRAADLERALQLAPEETREYLVGTHTLLLGQFTDGVGAYERLVAAAAGYAAEQGRTTMAPFQVTRLTEATDLLHGIATGLSELRTQPPRPSTL